MSNTMIDTVNRLDRHNRDVIRKAAKAAGVSNVSYNTKGGNIAELMALKVIDVTDDGEPVFDFSVVTDAAEAERAERLERALTEGLGYQPTHYSLKDGSTASWQEQTGSVIVFENEDGERFTGFADDWALIASALAPATDEPGVTYRLAMDGNGNSTLTLVVDGEMHTVPSSSVNYPRLVTALLAEEDPRPFLGDGIEAVLNWVTNNVSSRVTVEHARDEFGEAHAKVFIDEAEVHGKVIEQFKRYFLEGREPQNIVRFLEKVAENPLDVAEVGLYNWGSALTINEAGNFVGFKAVRVVHGEDGEIIGYTPSRTGPGAVNGVEPENGALIMNVGDTVTIDRSLVRPGPECGVGLHVGTWEYARGFISDGVVMEVEVDPADIVNVPNHETGKLRCVEFKVLGFHDANGVLAHHEPEATWDEESAVESVVDVFEDEQAKGWFRRLFGRR